MLRFIFCIYFLFFSVCLHAQEKDDQRIAVLKLNNVAQIPEQEANYLTDLIRQLASSELAQRFLIMDKENMMTLLPPDKTIADCVGQCAVDTGRLLGAAYIITGDIFKVENQLRVSIKLHDTRDSGLIGSEIASGNKVTDMESGIQQAGTRLLRHLIRDDYKTSKGKSSRRLIGENSNLIRATRKKVIATLLSKPKGAGVIVDGVQECSEGQDMCIIELYAGAHQISMTKAHYFMRSENVTIPESDHTLEWSLDPNFATLQVRTIPASLIYTINGKEHFGEHNQKIKPETAYRVVSSDPCYNKTGEEIIADALGSVVKVNLQPQPLQAVIDISAYNSQNVPIRAELHLDNNPLGQTPGEFLVSACSKSLVVKYQGHQDQSFQLSLNDGDVESLKIKLKALPPKPKKLSPREEALAKQQKRRDERLRRHKEAQEAARKRKEDDRRRMEDYLRQVEQQAQLEKRKREAQQRAAQAKYKEYRKKQQEKQERAETSSMVIQGIVYVGLAIAIVLGVIPL